MCPGMLLAVTVQLVLPLTKPVVYELDWDRADGQSPLWFSQDQSHQEVSSKPLAQVSVSRPLQFACTQLTRCTELFLISFAPPSCSFDQHCLPTPLLLLKHSVGLTMRYTVGDGLMYTLLRCPQGYCPSLKAPKKKLFSHIGLCSKNLSVDPFSFGWQEARVNFITRTCPPHLLFSLPLRF